MDRGRIMAKLGDLIINPNKLIKLTDGVNEYQFSWINNDDDIQMKDGSIHDPNDDGWELVTESLESVRTKRIKEVDNHTQQLIGGGFLFDGKMFSLSANAQLNWVAMSSSSDLLTWPVDITTIDDQEYSLSLAASPGFYLTALGTKQYYLDTGRALKIAMYAAVDTTELAAIVDPR